VSQSILELFWTITKNLSDDDIDFRDDDESSDDGVSKAKPSVVPSRTGASTAKPPVARSRACLTPPPSSLTSSNQSWFKASN
jgi:hypothetical protein